MESRARGRASRPRRERRWLADHGVEAAAPTDVDGGAKVLIAVDGTRQVSLIGDQLRSDADRLVPRLRDAGIRHVAIVTGDRRAVAEAVGDEARRRPRLRRADA